MNPKESFELPSRSIPERGSSISPQKGVPRQCLSRSPEKGGSPNLKRIAEWEEEWKECKKVAVKRKDDLRFPLGFDTAYWTARREITEKELELNELEQKISKESMRDKTRDFAESKEGQKLVLQEDALRLDIRLFEAQAEKKSKEEKFSLQKAFAENFLRSSMGLGLKTSRGTRSTSVQSSFRADFIARMGYCDPDNVVPHLWCPITSGYWTENTMRASHLFPWKGGEASMEAIFGLSPSGNSEMFTAENGMLWCDGAEQVFEAGQFVIVPDIDDEPTLEQVETWEASHPKQYKIRIFEPTHPMMQSKISGFSLRKWADLDNERVTFKTDFRPRARYLYFAYCCAMLRRSYQGHHYANSKAELGKRLWGIPGRYMRERMLLGFVQSMGHEYEHLLQGAIKEDGAEPDGEGVILANDLILKNIGTPEETTPEPEGDDDDVGIKDIDVDNDDSDDEI